MSLDKQIEQFRITVNSVNHDLPVQNMSIDWPNEYFNDTEFDRDAEGNLRQRLAGVRAEIQIQYDRSIDTSEWLSMLNDLQTHFVASNNASCEFYPDASKTTASDKIDVVLAGSWSYLTEYRNQINSFIPSITLRGYSRETAIPTDFQP